MSACSGKTSLVSSVSRVSCDLATGQSAASSCRDSEPRVSEPVTLAAIIRHYLLHYQPLHDQELMWFRNQNSLEDALRVAGRAQDDQGHRYSHQRRVRSPAIAAAVKQLAECHDDLQRCSSFHELWKRITFRLAPVRGIGERYIYDASVRIGAHLRFTPEKVYLHAGTRTGATRLGLLSERDGHKQWLNSGELPVLLLDLRSSDLENLLCIYKSRLQNDRAEGV
jgi:hypothetical protein